MTFNFGETFNINGANGDKSGLTFFNDTFWINKPSTPTPGWKDVTVTGEDSLNLPNAKADGLNYLKAYGKCYQGNLPYGYTQLEYLGATGTQYLKLGVNDSNPNLEIETTFSDIGGSGYRYIVGCWSNDNDQNTVVYINSSNQIGAWVCHSYAGSAMVTSDITEKHTVKVNKDAYYLDGYLIASLSPTGTERTGAELYAFKRNGAGGTSPQTTSITGKIHNISFKDNGVLIRNFIPARRNSDNELGLYDTITDTFLTNAGTGTFTAGPDLKPLPTYPLAITCNNGTIKVRNTDQIPDEYIRVASITGTTPESGSVYIDTNIGYSANLKIDCTVKDNGWVTYGNFFRVYESESAKAFRLLYTASANGTGYFTTGSRVANRSTTVYNLTPNVKHHIILAPNGITLDDVFTAVTELVSGTIPTTTLNLFMAGATGSRVVTWYDKVTVWDDDTVVFEGYTVKRKSDGAAGLYDKITSSFFLAEDATAGEIIYEIYIDGTTETIKDSLNNTATAENLLSAGTYKDVQSILDGTVTRNVGIKVLTGDETWTANTATVTSNTYLYWSLSKSDIGTDSNVLPAKSTNCLCTHYQTVVDVGGGRVNEIVIGASYINFITRGEYSTADDWKAFLQQQYANGTPVILIYPLATATTETVTAQTLTTKSGDNTIEITQASLGDLTLEAQYQAGVTVTIEEVEEANLDNNVTVVIGE